MGKYNLVFEAHISRCSRFVNAAEEIGIACMESAVAYRIAADASNV